MAATEWEFRNRALLFGLIFAFTFPLYSLDHENATALLAVWLAPKLHWGDDALARGLFALAAFILVASAFLRTWASAYLNAGIVYASEVKTASLVGDGPYRHMRNPLYFANVLMGIGMGAMMSRSGFVIALVLIVVFCYRLIWREEAELSATQGASYQHYLHAVPRLWPSLRARVPASGRPPRWGEAFRAESWYWGFAAALMAFAITLSLKLFGIIMAASIGLLWLSGLFHKPSPAA